MTTPAEKPIIYSGPMVRAILDDRKTQTRRVMKPAPSEFAPSPISCHELDEGGFGFFDEDRDYKARYQPGDRLYVRETWAAPAEWDDTPPCGIPSDTPIRYRSVQEAGPLTGKWRPSRHMPKWAARLWLEVTGVRVERLQDISTEDCIAEGLRSTMREHDAVCDLRDQFRKLWDSLNAKRAPWDSNPWVWIIEFRRVNNLRSNRDAAQT